MRNIIRDFITAAEAEVIPFLERSDVPENVRQGIMAGILSVSESLKVIYLVMSAPTENLQNLEKVLDFDLSLLQDNHPAVLN